MDWKSYETDPISVFDQIREFFKDEENREMVKRLAGGLVVTLAIAAGRYVYAEKKNYQLLQKNNRYKLEEK